MPEIVEAKEFLQMTSLGKPVLDVRSPGEFAHSHIPKAISLPLFSDEERHEVGYLYKQVSQSAAMVKGLEIAGPKMADFVQKATTIAPDKQIGIYCWRGGKRSESMAWLLENAGFKVTLLKGGYKAARRQFINAYSSSYRLIRLGGRTGSGKTRILRGLEAAGEQVIDLEDMAHHRGSAFGHLGLNVQPSNEFFENRIGEALLHMDTNRLIWVEDESRHLGKRTLPQPFWHHLTNAPVLFLDVSEDVRLKEILTHYGTQEIDGLKDAFRRISKRMGPQFVKAALDHLDQNDLGSAARLALQYYDRTYDYHLAHQTYGAVISIPIEELDISRIVNQLIYLAEENNDVWTTND